MKIKINLIFLLLFVFYFFGNAHSKVNNNIILKLESQIITNYEVKNKILTTLVLANQEINQGNVNQLKKQALDSLIYHKLKIIELSKHNFKNDEVQINTYLNKISSGNLNEFKAKFKKNGIDFQLFLDEVEIQLNWQKLIYKIYSNKIEIDENALNKELEDIIQNKSLIEEFKLSEIEISIENKKTDKSKIQTIQNLIKSEGFEAVAIKYSVSQTASNKGNLGWVNGRSLTNQVYNIINKLKVGDSTEPLKRQNSVLFLKLVDKKQTKSEDMNISQLKNNLIDQKKNELFNLYSKSYLSKLKNNTLIEYK